MPILENAQINVAEVLEVRGCYLDEHELWALLHQTAVAIQDLFLKDTAVKDGVAQHIITPESVLCSPSGKVYLSVCTPDSVCSTKYWCHDEGEAAFHEDAEKVYIFSLGKTILYASFYNRSSINKKNNISPYLKTLLQSMQQISPDNGMVLADIVEVCSVRATKSMNGLSFQKIVAKLNKEVLGNLFECEFLDQDEKFCMKRHLSCQDVLDYQESNSDSLDSEALLWAKYSHSIDCCSEPQHHSQLTHIEIPRNPKERWRAAVKKITDKKSQLEQSDSITQQFIEYQQESDASGSILSVYKELLKRRKMLELIKLSIDNEPFLSSDATKSSLFQEALKSKTLEELVKVLEHVSKEVSSRNLASNSLSQDCLSVFDAIVEEFPSTKDNLNTGKYTSQDVQTLHAKYCKDNILEYIDGVPLKTYYSIKDVVTKSKPADIEHRFQGPEFIIGSLKPHTKTSLTVENMVGEDRTKEDVSVYIVSVVPVNGEQIDLTCSPAVTGRQILQTAIQHLELQEHYLFGLAYIQDEEFIFINGKEKLSKICQSVWPDDSSLLFNKDSITLYLRIKFYVEDTNMIRSPSTLHLYYLQLRRDILDGFTQCHPSSAVILGGLALQAEIGNYILEEMSTDYFLLEHYFPYHCITRLGRDASKKKLNESHIGFCGISHEVAEQMFMQNVLRLSEYGCHFHRVLQSKRNPASQVWLAVNSKGLELHEDTDGNRKKYRSYPWSKIKRISFTKRCLCLLPKFEASLDKHAAHKFYTSHPFKSQYLFHLTVNHHLFFVKLKSKFRSFEICPDDLETEVGFYAGTNEWCSEADPDREIGFDFQSTEDLKGSSLGKRARCINSLKNFHLPQLSHTQQFKKICRKEKFNRSSVFLNKSLPYAKYLSDCIHGSSESLSIVTRSASAPECSSRIRRRSLYHDHMHRNYIHEKVPGTMPRTSCRKRQLKMVRLIKESCGLGMTITCGDTYDTVLHGAFLELITPGGPADRDGNLSPGDQILSVNGIDVQKEHFLDVADLIQKSDTCIELVIAKSHLNIKNIEKLDSDKEEIEPSFVKVKTWISDSCSDLPDSPEMIKVIAPEGNCGDKSPPIPKPRKKWLEKDSPCVIVNKLNSVPDLAVESCLKVLTEVSQIDKDTTTSEMDCSIISEHLFRGCSSFPDIIPSQVKIADTEDSAPFRTNGDVDISETTNEDVHSSLYSFQTRNNSNNPTTNAEIKNLTPGDVYHVVLEKRNGSLGLNIFQGTEPSCSPQKHIYIHSLIPGGSAEIDNRICSGDKLLEVNGVTLEDLSYNEVVNTLRESAQVTYLVLEKGNSANPNIIDVSKQGKHSPKACGKPGIVKVMDKNSIIFQKIATVSSPKSNFKIDPGNDLFAENSNALSGTNKIEISHPAVNGRSHSNQKENGQGLDMQFGAFDKGLSCMSSNKNSISPNVISKNLRNSVSLNSLSSSKEILHIETGISEMYLDSAKDFLPSGSLPTLNQKPNSGYCIYETDTYTDEQGVPHIGHIDASNYIACSTQISVQSDCINEGLSSPPFTKDPQTVVEISQAVTTKSLVTHRSTPNLTEAPDDESSKIAFSLGLYRNKSTDCLAFLPDSNESKAKVLGNSDKEVSRTKFDQVPKVPLRKKRLKKLEDILNFSNSENTFSVALFKSTRGLGLSISGGHDAQKKDPLSQLIRIRKLYPLQPAMQCGELAVGDIILEVNGTSMIGLSNTEALETLRAAAIHVKLKLLRPSKSLLPFSTLQDEHSFFSFDSPSSSASSSLSRTDDFKIEDSNSGEFEVTLRKNEGSLGFSVSKRESLDHGPPAGIYVKSLIREPAISDGRIQPGDRIVQVNGEDVTSLSHTEAIAFLRNAPDTVALTLFRCDPPLSPNYLEDDHPVSKPLRWEAMELLNDRVKHKDTENCGDKKKIKRKLHKCSNGQNSSTESESTSSSSSSSSGKEHIINPEVVIDKCEDDNLNNEGPGLQRNQRPKSLDMLNSSDRKRISEIKNEESFHRQASVMGNSSDMKSNAAENGETSVGSPNKKGGKALLKWRGSTLPSTENSLSSTSGASDGSPLSPEKKNIYSSDLPYDEGDGASSLTFDSLTAEVLPMDEPDGIVKPQEIWVRTFDVELDRKWYGRLGFSLSDPSPDETSFHALLPQAPVVKAVHSGSLAAKDGRIENGDRLVKVNSESVLGKSASETIVMMRILTGQIKMVFCRLEGVA